MDCKQYLELKREQEKKVNSLPLIFAYSEEQLESRVLELTGKSLNDYMCDGGTFKNLGYGAMCLSRDYENVLEALSYENDMNKRILSDETLSIQAFYYEMCNHEYSINYQADYDTISCFYPIEWLGDCAGYREYFASVGASNDIVMWYESALNEYWEDANEKGWY